MDPRGAAGDGGGVTHGLVVGAFLPPHAGHAMLIETAQALVERLTILLLWRADDPIPGSERLGWLRELFPLARVAAAEVQEWETVSLAPIVHGAVEAIDLLFSADNHGRELAQVLGARHVMLDPAHAAVPIADVEVRADPFGHWRYLPPPVRGHYARTICLHGPESTGKSTLAPQLARHFDTSYVPEYGRTYCEQHGLALGMRDLVAIGRTHAAMIHALKRVCNRRLILDTDPVMTAAWAEMLFNARDPWFDAFDDTADLYLLLDIDMPWVDDGTRFFGDEARRRRFFDLSRAELERRGLRYIVIGGPAEERFDRALAALGKAGLG